MADVCRVIWAYDSLKYMTRVYFKTPSFESEEWSSLLIFQIKQLERRSLKKSGLQQDSNPWPPRYRCDALPTEVWRHTLGARSIYWVHISREEWNDVKYIYVIGRLGGPYREKLWPRSWKCCPRPQAEGSIFKPEFTVFYRYAFSAQSRKLMRKSFNDDFSKDI